MAVEFVTRQEDLKIPKGGLILTPQKPEDYIMGATSPIEKVVLQENGQWDGFLPIVEIQRLPDNQYEQESYMCVSFSNQNCKEILHKRKYGYEINMDDQYLGVGSGTVRGQGNSVSGVAEWSRKNGWIKEKGRFAWENMDQVYTPVTQEELAEGLKSLEVYESKYAWLPRGFNSQVSSIETLKEHLKYGPVQASVDGSAYTFNQQGYIGTFVNYTHEIVIFGYEEGKYWKIFDSETQQPLRFAWDYPFGFPMLHDFKKKVVTEVVRQTGKANCYLYSAQLDSYFAIADSDEIVGANNAIGKVPGGDLVKPFSGGKYPFIPERDIPVNKIIGEIKARRF